MRARRGELIAFVELKALGAVHPLIPDGFVSNSHGALDHAVRLLCLNPPPPQLLACFFVEEITRRMPFSWMWRRVGIVNWTDVSEERITSIFRVEQSACGEPT
jgi:hypothetical protein